MSREDSGGLLWYVIHTNPRQEDRAYKNLAAWGVETFLPKIKECRPNPYSSKTTFVVKPFFPGYIFARFGAGDLFHKIRFTRGIHSIVSFGNSPTPIDDHMIKSIKARVDAEGYVRLGEELRAGDEVTIKSGLLRNFSGVFERSLKDGDRVMILLEAVNYQAHLVIERQMIERLAS